MWDYINTLGSLIDFDKLFKFNETKKNALVIKFKPCGCILAEIQAQLFTKIPFVINKITNN